MSELEFNETDPSDINSLASSTPDRYKGANGIECIDAIHAALGDGGFEAFCVGQCLRYLFRYKRKNGLNDLRKAEDYLHWAQEQVEENTKERCKLGMENYFKISFASFMAFAISSLLSYLVLPYNDVLASVIAWGAIIMLVIATFAFAVAIYCFVFQTFAHQQCKEYSDDCREQNRIEMFEIVSTDVETSNFIMLTRHATLLRKLQAQVVMVLLTNRILCELL